MPCRLCAGLDAPALPLRLNVCRDRLSAGPLRPWKASPPRPHARSPSFSAFNLEPLEVVYFTKSLKFPIRDCRFDYYLMERWTGRDAIGWRVYKRIMSSRGVLLALMGYFLVSTSFSQSSSLPESVKGERVWNSTCFPSNLTRNHSKSTALKVLKYSDGSFHPVLLPYVAWESAMIVADITYILLNEIMGYSVVLVEIDTVFDSYPVNFAAGCFDPDDPTCAQRDFEHPIVHLTIESWMMGIRRASLLPPEVQPVLLSVLDYAIDDQIFLWQDTIASALGHLSLDYYRSYDATFYKPHVYFDHWTRIFELLPESVIVRCSTMTPGSVHERLTDHYTAFSNDTDVSCLNDTVWFSLSCRANTSECIPVIVQYGTEMVMQLSFFYNMPIALVVVDQGDNDYAEYYAAIRASRMLFSWFFPQVPAPAHPAHVPLRVPSRPPNLSRPPSTSPSHVPSRRRTT